MGCRFSFAFAGRMDSVNVFNTLWYGADVSGADDEGNEEQL